MSPIANNQGPYKKRRGHRQTQREGDVKIEVEIGVLQLQAKDARDHW